MAVTISGTTGINLVQDGTIVTADIVDANVTTAKIVDANITAAKLSGAQTGAAPIYGCRAWCVFDSTRNVTDTGASTNGQPVLLKANGNVTSVTKNAEGDYTVNFTTAVPSVNYTMVGSGNSFNAGNAQTVINFYATNAAGAGAVITTTTCRILVSYASTGALAELGIVSLQFVG